MKILVDTNILGRLSQPRHAHHAIAASAVETLLRKDEELRLVPQVIYEFWAIGTRAISQNGLGLTVSQVESELHQFRVVFPPLRDERGILEPWQKLVSTHHVQGKATHDARLVAAMLRHNITHILTFNADDFKRYPGIVVLTPDSVVTP